MQPPHVSTHLVWGQLSHLQRNAFVLEVSQLSRKMWCDDGAKGVSASLNAARPAWSRNAVVFLPPASNVLMEVLDLLVLPCTHCILCACLPDQHGRGGGGHGPGGLEGQVPGPGGAAHEVQNADHQDPRADCWQGRWKGTGFWSAGPHFKQVNDAPRPTPWNYFVSMFGRLIKTYCTIRKLRWSSVREDVSPPPSQQRAEVCLLTSTAMVTSQSHQHWAVPNCSVA